MEGQVISTVDRLMRTKNRPLDLVLWRSLVALTRTGFLVQWIQEKIGEHLKMIIEIVIIMLLQRFFKGEQSNRAVAGRV